MHRQMQKVNSLCTDSKPLPAEYCIVGIPSSLQLNRNKISRLYEGRL